MPTLQDNDRDQKGFYEEEFDKMLKRSYTPEELEELERIAQNEGNDDELARLREAEENGGVAPESEDGGGQESEERLRARHGLGEHDVIRNRVTPEKTEGDGAEPKSSTVAKPAESEAGAGAAADGGEDGSPKGLRQKAQAQLSGFGKAKSKLKNKKVLAIAGSAIILFMGVLMMLLLLSSLKLQDLAVHIFEYNALRTVRTLNQTAEDEVADRFAVDAADSAEKDVQNSLKSKASDFVAKFDKFRPQKMIDNLEGAGRLQYVYDEVPRDVLPGTKLELRAIRIDGKDIPLPESKFGRLFSNFGNSGEFTRQVEGALQEAVPESYAVVRSSAANIIREKIGFSSLSWWQRKASDFFGKNEADAFKLQQQEAYEKIKAEPDTSATVPQAAEAAQEASAKVDEAVKDGSAADTNLAIVQAEEEGAQTAAAVAGATASNLEVGGTGSAVTLGGEQATQDLIAQSVDEASASVRKDLAASAVENLSTLYQIAFPYCMVFDGSVVHNPNGASAVDKKSAAAQRTYYSVVTAADQQKHGDTNAAAVGAMNDKIGNAQSSIPQLRSDGSRVDTRSQVAGPDEPQTAGFGVYSPINLFIGDNAVSDFLNNLLGSVCPKVLDLKVAAFAAVIEWGAAFFTGGTDEAALEGAAQAAKVAAEKVGTDVVQEQVVKAIGEEATQEASKGIITNQIRETFSQKAGGFVKKLGLDIVKYGSITILFKMLVYQHMMASYNGLSHGSDYANEADAGGNLHFNEIQRTGYGGRPLTPQEVTMSTEADLAYLHQQQGQKSAVQRYFAVSNPDSVVSRMGFSMLGKLSDMRVNLPQSVSSWLNLSRVFSLQNMFAFMGLGNNNKVSAADLSQSGNYGIVQMGWSEDELALIRSNSKYRPTVNADIVASDPTLYQHIDDQYGKCFTESMGQLLEDQDISRNDDGSIVDDQTVLCSPTNLSYHNPTYGDAVFRYRLSKLNTAELDMLLGIQDPTATPTNGGGGTPTGGEPSQTPHSNNLIVFGDSLTVGMRDYGDMKDTLTNKYGWNVLDIDAVGGKDLAWGLDQMKTPEEADKIRNAGAILIGLGTNNVGNYPGSMDATKNTMQDIVDYVKGLKPDIAIYWTDYYGTGTLTTQYGSFNLDNAFFAPDGLNAALKEVADKNHVALLHWSTSPIAKQYVASGDVHPSGHYPEMAAFITNALGHAPVAGASP